MEEVSLHEVDIKEIISLVEGTSFPDQLADLKVKLAGNYFYLSERLTSVLVEKNKVWEELRTGCSSDLQAERKWQHTESGTTETKIKLKMKAIEKLLSAVSSKLSVAQNEIKLS